MRKFSRPTHTVGHPPGTLKLPPLEQPRPVTVKRIAFDESSLEEQSFDRVEDCLELRATSLTTWIDVDGVHDAAAIEALGEHFELHPLLLEDIVHAVQRSKVEQYGECTYIVGSHAALRC